MSVYVGIDVHRKRSQVAVVAGDGQVQLNRNVVNSSAPMLRLIGGCRLARRWRSRRPTGGDG
jgi:ATP-dependent protease HslVU (ClpYQ) peptidase subunit